jgi:hypothetical protein
VQVGHDGPPHQMLICIVIAIGHLIMFTDSHRLFPSWIFFCGCPTVGP